MFVPEEGLEPSRAKAHTILNRARIPIPPLRHDYGYLLCTNQYNNYSFLAVKSKG